MNEVLFFKIAFWEKYGYEKTVWVSKHISAYNAY